MAATAGPSTGSGDVKAAAVAPKVRLQSGDKEIFIVDLPVAKMSKVIKGMIEDLAGEEDPNWDTLEPIPLSNVSGPILRKVITWMEHHYKNDGPEPERPEDDLSHFTDEISDWDEEYIKVDQGTLFELILASNYLNIKKLRTVGCKTVANVLRKLSVEEIREKYNIENDFTPEEEEAIRKENEWCEDQDASK
ncbi:putative Skp1-related protein [Hypsibius exemplaris]|uniref:Skp1-related protein n=1 Tax=Hypsibius exemplaris TaxID=2072580 RepID=A0A1W0WVE8_HYPEX|nr:putative Skp1-related protein [Hypsibius exemplaris]